jgi:hypothetical protein
MTNFRIKLVCNWCDPKKLCDDWNRMSKGNYKWNNIEVTWEDHNIDFYVIINIPTSYFVPNRTIIFQMEPWCGSPNQNWGVKTWGIWAKPDEELFLQVRNHEKFYNNCFWQLSLTYNDFKTKVIEKTKLMSSICSSKYFDPGHIKRIDFLKFIENKNDDVVKIDIYNTDNNHNFKNYVGSHPENCKEIGIMPYKYYFMPENNEEKNFITEKIWEPLLTETLTFYWGCPNIADYIDPRAYILLDLNDYEKSFNIVKNAILNNEWEKRLEIIRMEKQKVLEYFNFFPTLSRIINQDLKFSNKPSDQDIVYHKYFNHIINKKINNILFIQNFKSDIIEHIKTQKIFDYTYIIIPKNESETKYTDLVTEKIRIITFSDSLSIIKTFSKYNTDSNILFIDYKNDSLELLNNYNSYLLNLNSYNIIKLNESWISKSNNILNDNIHLKVLII